MRGVWLGIALGVAICGPARAQDGAENPADALDLTMTLLPEGATTPDPVTRTIQLPDAAALRADPPGIERANEARRDATGPDTAAEAREQGRDFGQQIAQQAQEARENAGRGADRERPGQPDRPEPVPDSPGPPEDRGPPLN